MGVDPRQEDSACETAEEKIKRRTGMKSLVLMSGSVCTSHPHTGEPNGTLISMIKALDIHLTITRMLMSHRVSI